MMIVQNSSLGSSKCLSQDLLLRKVWNFNDKIVKQFGYKVQAKETNHCNLDQFLYIGLVTISIGLIFIFIGVGDQVISSEYPRKILDDHFQQGFKTLELRITGPCLILLGSCLIFLRLLCCLCFKRNDRSLELESSEIEHLLTTKTVKDDVK